MGARTALLVLLLSGGSSSMSHSALGEEPACASLVLPHSDTAHKQLQATSLRIRSELSLVGLQVRDDGEVPAATANAPDSTAGACVAAITLEVVDDTMRARVTVGELAARAFEAKLTPATGSDSLSASALIALRVAEFVAATLQPRPAQSTATQPPPEKPAAPASAAAGVAPAPSDPVAAPAGHGSEAARERDASVSIELHLGVIAGSGSLPAAPAAWLTASTPLPHQLRLGLRVMGTLPVSLEDDGSPVRITRQLAQLVLARSVWSARSFRASAELGLGSQRLQAAPVDSTLPGAQSDGVWIGIASVGGSMSYQLSDWARAQIAAGVYAGAPNPVVVFSEGSRVGSRLPQLAGSAGLEATW